MTKTLMIIIIALYLPVLLFSQDNPIIIDHNCTDIDVIPEEYIQKAKEDFHIGYGHTSHGSQIISGIELIQSEKDLFEFNQGEGSLNIKDRITDNEYKARDLGNPNFTAWAGTTENLLNMDSNQLNMILWSWCGQVSGASEKQINLYLSQMNDLEMKFPYVTFIYMTGHLDGIWS